VVSQIAKSTTADAERPTDLATVIRARPRRPPHRVDQRVGRYRAVGVQR
jgi:hypothetical protein